MPKQAWEALQHGKTPWPSLNSYARDLCRVCVDHSGGYRSSDRPTAAFLVEDLIHGSFWGSTPTIQRKRFAQVIRSLINKQREKRERLKGFMRPGQSACFLP
jgi:hypothetical protein